MSEMAKTLTFVVTGLVAALAAWASRPTYNETATPDGVGQLMFADFEDPFDAASLEVVEYDEELGEISTFEIAQKDGSWVIPSHEDYPADAEENFKDAATLLIGLDVIALKSENLADHKLYGVVAPNPDDVQAGDRGVGKLIVMKDAQGSRLAELVIGKEVKDQPGQRYVRRPSENAVYIVEIDPDKVSTKFEDWIKDDLLELNAWDVEQMEIHDYSVQSTFTPQGLAVQYDQRFLMTVNWTEDSKWELGELSEFRNNRLQPTEPLETEELNKEALDAMKSALDDLKIVDVARKPEGLRADLSADKELSQDRETVESLINRGYYPASMPDGSVQLLSSEGEIICRTKDGVEYKLRFGDIAVGQDESELNRFVMVTTAVHEDSFERPVLEPLPEETSADASSEGDSDDNTDAADDADTEDTDTAAEDADVQETAAEDTDDTSTESTDAGEAAEEEEDADSDKTAAEKELDAERERILKENQRKLDDYNEKRKQAEEKVAELNFRFAPWYYVISEDVYKKLHLSRADVLVEKEGAESESNTIDAFRSLEQEGLEKESDDNDSSGS